MEITNVNEELSKEIVAYEQAGNHWIIFAQRSPETNKIVGDIGEACYGHRDFPCMTCKVDDMPMIIVAFPKSKVTEDTLRENLSLLIGPVAHTLEATGNIIYLVRPEYMDGVREAFQAFITMGTHRPGRN